VKRKGDVDGSLQPYRRRSYGTLVVALVAIVALAIPVAQGTARPGSETSVPIERHLGPNSCGVSHGKKIIGSARFTRSGDTVTIAWKLNGADPGSYYALYLFDAHSCKYFALLGKFKVDASGSGSKIFSGDASGYENLYACDYNFGKNRWDCSHVVRT
jgi:hypothetical protein